MTAPAIGQDALLLPSIDRPALHADRRTAADRLYNPEQRQRAKHSPELSEARTKIRNDKLGIGVSSIMGLENVCIGNIVLFDGATGILQRAIEDFMATVAEPSMRRKNCSHSASG